MIKEGSLAPAFSLPDQTGEHRSLSQYQGQWVVLYFYPKDDTSGCTAEACAFRDNRGALQSENTAVLGVSADPVPSHKQFAEKYNLNFPLLADTEHVVCEAYGVWQEKSMYGKEYWGIARTTFLIDGEGIVRKVFEQVKPAGHAEEVLQAIHTIRG